MRVVSPASGTATVLIRHTTLVPGRSLHRDGTPVQPGAPSLVVGDGVDVRIEHSILGGIRSTAQAGVSVSGSIVDAGSTAAPAFAGADAAGGHLACANTTVIGRVHATSVGEVTNCLFAGREQRDPDDARSVLVARRQTGCVRFCFVPPDALVPRRFRCPPETAADAERVRPVFTSLRYGDPGYGQLGSATAPEIRRGADDESEMGVHHDVQQPARITNLLVRLDEFPPVAMEAGVFYES